MGVERKIYLFWPRDIIPKLEKQVEFLIENDFQFLPSALKYALDGPEWIPLDFGARIDRADQIIKNGRACLPLLQNWAFKGIPIELAYVDMSDRYIARILMTDRSIWKLYDYFSQQSGNLTNFLLEFANLIEADLMVATSEWGPETDELIELAERIDRFTVLLETPAELIFDRTNLCVPEVETAHGSVVKLRNGFLFSRGIYLRPSPVE